MILLISCTVFEGGYVLYSRGFGRMLDSEKVTNGGPHALTGRDSSVGSELPR